MARWLALVVLPDFPSRLEAERYAAVEYSRSLVRIESRASWEVGEAERQMIAQRRRLAAESLGQGDGVEPEP